jgi:uncharacterized alpha-E superfamily protein
VLDALAVPLLREGGPATHAEVQWTALLRSLSALQAYYQRKLAPVTGASTVALVLHDPDFPGSIRHCLDEIGAALTDLPRCEAPTAATRVARRTSAGIAGQPGRLHDDLIDLRVDLTAVHAAIEATYFPPSPDSLPGARTADPEPAPVTTSTRTD